MPASLRFTLLGLLVAFSVSPLVADILVVGSTREAVITELGKPTSVARRGTHEILLYPKGVRIELSENQVIDLKGYIPSGGVPPKSAAPAPVPAAAAVQTGTSSAAPLPNAPNATSAVRVAAPAESAAVTHTPGPTEVMAKDDGEDESDLEDRSLGFSIGVTAIMLAAQFLLTFAALKIAFHYHQMDALWSGVFAITGIDVALQTLFTVILYFQSGEVRLGIAGTGLPGLAMIFTIRHFCLDQRWTRAVATTSAVKIAAVLLNIGVLALVAQFT